MKTELFELHAQMEERHWWFTGRRRIMRALVREVVPPGTGALVVDVGCGTGANLAALADEYRCVGIDTSAEAIELAARRFHGIEFIHGFAPGDLGSHAADAKLSLLMDVLEHVEDDFLLLSRLLAASSPGAHFLITVPANEALWSEHDVSFGHYRRYDRARLEALWSGLPVTPRLVSYFNARLYPVVRAVRAVSRLRGRAGGAAGTDLALPAAPINRALERAFAGEARRLVERLHGRRSRGYRAGVSLIALVRREAGEITPRARPQHVPADLHTVAATHGQRPEQPAPSSARTRQ